jgi:hypothetical protein
MWFTSICRVLPQCCLSIKPIALTEVASRAAIVRVNQVSHQRSQCCYGFVTDFEAAVTVARHNLSQFEIKMHLTSRTAKKPRSTAYSQ